MLLLLLVLVLVLVQFHLLVSNIYILQAPPPSKFPLILQVAPFLKWQLQLKDLQLYTTKKSEKCKNWVEEENYDCSETQEKPPLSIALHLWSVRRRRRRKKCRNCFQSHSLMSSHFLGWRSGVRIKAGVQIEIFRLKYSDWNIRIEIFRLKYSDWNIQIEMNLWKALNRSYRKGWNLCKSVSNTLKLFVASLLQIKNTRSS